MCPLGRKNVLFFSVICALRIYRGNSEIQMYLMKINLVIHLSSVQVSRPVPRPQRNQKGNSSEATRDYRTFQRRTPDAQISGAAQTGRLHVLLAEAKQKVGEITAGQIPRPQATLYIPTRRRSI